MRVVEFHPGLLPDLTQVLNEHIRSMPPGFTMTEAQVLSTLERARDVSIWLPHYPKSRDTAARATFRTTCVLDSARLVAAALWMRPDPTDTALSQPNTSSVDWIVAAPDSKGAVNVLLDAVVEQSRSMACSRIDVAPRFAFGVGWLGIPATWSHVVEGLVQAGMEVYEKWLIMIADVGAVGEPLPPKGFSHKWTVKEPASEWMLLAYHGQTKVGECEAWGIPAHFEGCSGFEEWVTVEFVEVEEAYRRQGLGRFLMQEQMRFQAARGIRKAILWTETDNMPARRLLESLGFADGPECWSFRMPI